MAELIWLVYGKHPPTNERWVLIDQESRGIAGLQDVMIGPPESSATFYVVEPFGDAEWADAIAKAIKAR
jgi:hypothetical protein